MIKIGKMLQQLLSSLGEKPATHRYPFERVSLPPRFRGKLKFYPEKCIGCRLCMRDCPSAAIQINKIGEKRFEAVISLDRCIYCAQCVDVCPKKALEITSEFELAQLDRKNLKAVFSPPAEPPSAGQAGATNASPETKAPEGA
ncbi:MAG: 4Fe-4S binding protein [Kiritimatiellae bacterium]|nr:4Fe-4S binding protein [Kiritimatiellia bacterium]